MGDHDSISYKGCKFNYYFCRNGYYLVYSALYSKLYQVSKEAWDFLHGHSAASPPLQDILFQHGLIVESDTDEEALMYHTLQSVIYENRLEITIIPTEACNFRCIYCFEPHNNNYMSDEVERKIIKYFRRSIHKYKSVLIDWFGGEPLLEKDRIIRMMEGIKQLCRQNGVPLYSTMVTNGYLLDVSTFDQLVDTGVVFFQITIDGPSKIHDQRRQLVNGAPTFDAIYKNIIHIKEQSKHKYFHITIRSNIGKADYAEYQEFLTKILTELGDDKRFIFSCEPICDWGGESVKALDGKLFDNLTQLSEYLIPDIKLHEFNLYNILMSSLTENRCNAGKVNGFTINFDGRVYKCGMGSDDNESFNYIGAINDQGILKVNEANNARFLRLAKVFEKCEGCCWLPQCLICNCPYSCARNKSMRCIKEFAGVPYLEETLWNGFIHGKAIDLTKSTEV